MTFRTISRPHRSVSLAACCVIAAAAVAMLAGGASAVVPAATGHAHTAKLTTIKLSLNFDPPGPEDAPVFYGLEKGYYAAQGLDVKIVPTKGSLLAVNNVGTNTADIGVADATTAMLGIGQGVPDIAVGTLYGSGGFGLYVDKKTGITKLSQMSGHSVVVSAGSAGALLLPPALRAAGLDPNSVKTINVTSAALISTYVGGQGDSVSTTIPSAVAQIQPHRPSNAIPFSSVGIVAPGYSILVNKNGSLLEQHPNLIAAFLRATYKAELGSIASAQAAAQALADLNPFDDIQVPVYQAGFQAWHGNICSPDQAGKPIGYPVAADWSKGAGILAQYSGLPGSTAATRFETAQFFGPKYKTPVSTGICRKQSLKGK